MAQLKGPVNAEITPKVQGYLLRQNYQNGYFVRKGNCCLNSIPGNIRPLRIRPRPMWPWPRQTCPACRRTLPETRRWRRKVRFRKSSWTTTSPNSNPGKRSSKPRRRRWQNAELNLGWTKVYSPIDGIAGVSNSQVGDLVGTATKMTTVSQVNPIWAYFNVSEEPFPGIRSHRDQDHHRQG